MNKANLPYINTLLILVIGVIVIMNILGKEKTPYVYVDNFKLFNGFHMAKEMNELHGKDIQAQTQKVDSIYKLYQTAAEAKNEEQLKAFEMLLKREDAILKQTKEYLSKDVTKQVWDRLNNYIKEYGEKHDVKIIFGAQGDGNIMYSKTFLNQTEAILAYANSRYEGNE